MKRFLSKKGFSLIELIIVIAIMAILAAIIVPTVINKVGESKDTASFMDAKNLANAITNYSVEHPDYDWANVNWQEVTGIQSIGSDNKYKNLTLGYEAAHGVSISFVAQSSGLNGQLPEVEKGSTVIYWVAVLDQGRQSIEVTD